MISRAEFSPCGRYRYFLSREWMFGRGRLLYCMLNPSTADEVINDPTVERCQRRAEAFGYKSFAVVNIFAWRSTDPSVLTKIADPIGPKNNHWIKRAAREADLVICAWGKDGAILNRGRDVLKILAKYSTQSPCALKINGDGTPAHPLYLSYELKPFPMEISKA